MRYFTQRDRYDTESWTSNGCYRHWPISLSEVKKDAVYERDTTMLSNRALQEMKEDANSAKIREDCERLKAFSRTNPSQPVDVDQVIKFLSTMARFGPQPPPREPVHYPRALL